ncbi:uncharacterized protein PGTG_07929 [Puccinia graminis f. sp. tritici CRL 75-36-700-3]|uniref:Uncharacterized protein n=1 Tax=Puccinia graminis f. sp. tritici (strain CRL 75-36-700-3 / race SCCL) TaxID=418459 RepID=E3KBI2_PUCGT|nr:uncharacterized protein PGTG_07929 [Puccinia graminis f. sp. tritici CRL 75-36-700-3]EFP81680.1 hypothetical protein PGTG_07929 [Puccinia graminis f. sp. tritici CRL 75-36-700-3]
MFRRSRIPLNSTDPSILEELLERQQQPSPPTPNTLRFMIPPESPSHSSTQHPQPRLKSLIKLDHLLRPLTILKTRRTPSTPRKPDPSRSNGLQISFLQSQVSDSGISSAKKDQEKSIN